MSCPPAFCRCLKGFLFATLRSETFPRNFSREKFAALQWGKGFDIEIYAKIDSYSGVRNKNNKLETAGTCRSNEMLLK